MWWWIQSKTLPKRCYKEITYRPFLGKVEKGGEKKNRLQYAEIYFVLFTASIVQVKDPIAAVYFIILVTASQ